MPRGGSKTERIRQHLEEEGLTVQEAAAQAGVSVRHVRRLAAARGWPTNKPMAPGSLRESQIYKALATGVPESHIVQLFKLAPIRLRQLRTPPPVPAPVVPLPPHRRGYTGLEHVEPPLPLQPRNEA